MSNTTINYYGGLFPEPSDSDLKKIPAIAHDAILNCLEKNVTTDSEMLYEHVTRQAFWGGIMPSPEDIKRAFEDMHKADKIEIIFAAKNAAMARRYSTETDAFFSTEPGVQAYAQLTPKFRESRNIKWKEQQAEEINRLNVHNNSTMHKIMELSIRSWIALLVAIVALIMAWVK